MWTPVFARYHWVINYLTQFCQPSQPFMEVISALIYLYKEGAEGKKGSETGEQSVKESLD